MKLATMDSTLVLDQSKEQREPLLTALFRNFVQLLSAPVVSDSPAFPFVGREKAMMLLIIWMLASVEVLSQKAILYFHTGVYLLQSTFVEPNSAFNLECATSVCQEYR